MSRFSVLLGYLCFIGAAIGWFILGWISSGEEGVNFALFLSSMISAALTVGAIRLISEPTGFPIEEEDLKKNIAFKLLAQYDIGGQHFALLGELNGKVRLCKTSCAFAREGYFKAEEVRTEEENPTSRLVPLQ